MNKEGIILVVSAPSGAGKRTVVEALRRSGTELVTTISATTREPRPDEVEGEDYYFLDRAEFERRKEQDGFVEWAAVHGNLYGTLREELERCVNTGTDVLLELDVQGMRALKAVFPGAVSVFIAPPSLDALEERLRKRGANTEEDMALRLENARDEMAANTEYDYVVVNDKVERAAEDLAAILRAEKLRPARVNIVETA